VQADKVKLDNRFIQRQSTANAIRFTTVDLGELETKIAKRPIRPWRWELRLFADLVGEVHRARRRCVKGRGRPLP
jgi:DNA mismatch repair protein MutS